jgi:hypothetical protein
MRILDSLAIWIFKKANVENNLILSRMQIGGKYLIAFDRKLINKAWMESVDAQLKERYLIHAIWLGVDGIPTDSLKVFQILDKSNTLNAIQPVIDIGEENER